MTMNKDYGARKILFFGIVMFLLVGCGVAQSATVLPSTTTTREKPFPSTATVTRAKPISTPKLDPVASETAYPTTIDPTYQAWYATAVVIQGTARALSQQSLSDNATKAAQFSIACDGKPSGSISPNERWLATSCGSKTDQTLIVQNREGTKYILEFKDLLSLDSPDGMPGWVKPNFWSPDGKYLYFTTELGYSGGGDECFPGLGDVGLFRLDLETGLWTILIPPTNYFPGYNIKFSPTGRRYATDINEVMIIDLNTGEVTKIDVPGIIQGLSWSPDGIHLAYSVASCDQGVLQSSSVYVWDALTNQTQSLITTDDMLLRPELWSDNLILRVEGEKYVSPHNLYTIYVYDVSQDNLVFTGTATPSP